MVNRENWDWEAGKREIVDLGGLQAQFEEVHEFAVSPDGERIAVPVKKGQDVLGVWTNGNLWDEEFEKAWNLRFTPDGRLLALVRVDDMWTVADEGKRWEEEFDFVWNPQVSRDGDVVAVQVKRGTEYTIMSNGKPWEKGFPSMREFCLSPDGKRIAAAVQVETLPEADIFKFMEGTWSVAVDGEPWKQKFINAYSPAFSQDGRRVAAEVRLDICEYTVAEEGEPWKNRFGCTWAPSFRTQERGILVPVRVPGGWTLAHNGKPLWSGRYVQLWHQTSSPDDARIAAIAAVGYGKWTLVVDDTPWPISFEDMVLPPVFSPDGKRLAAIGKDGERWGFAVDKRKWSSTFDMAWDPVFSPDGSAVAAKVEHNGKFGVVLDDRMWSPRFDRLWDPVFSPDGENLLIRSIEGEKFQRQIVPVSTVRKG
jgi:hypothetical protein